MQNIEIKTILRDPSAMEAKLASLGASREWQHVQRDLFFNVPVGWLKLREVEGQPGELIAYVREPGRHARASDYDIARIDDVDGLTEVLDRSLGLKGVVEKTRTLYTHRHTRIHLDDVRGLGSFLELETVIRGISLPQARAEAREMIQLLELDKADFIEKPYMQQLLELTETVVIDPGA